MVYSTDSNRSCEILRSIVFFRVMRAFNPFPHLETLACSGGEDNNTAVGDVGSLQCILEDYLEVDRYQVSIMSLQ